MDEIPSFCTSLPSPTTQYLLVLSHFANSLEVRLITLPHLTTTHPSRAITTREADDERSDDEGGDDDNDDKKTD